MSNADPGPVPLLVDAASALLESAGRTLLTTSLNKALFYLDLHSLLETGETVTKASYVALKAGPVVESYHDALITGLERHCVAQQDDDDPNYKPIVLLHRVYPTRLTPEQLNIAKKIAVWAKGNSATTLSRYSHENPGWIAAFQHGVGSEIDMNLAMQQLLEDDARGTRFHLLGAGRKRAANG